MAIAEYDTWVAERSGTDLREVWVETLAKAQRAADQNHHEEALGLLEELGSSGGSADLIYRATLLESWSNMVLGELDKALLLAQRALDLAENPNFTDFDRADALFHLGCIRLKRSEDSLAASLFTVALELCNRTIFPCDRLRASVYHWRSRCYQRQRDWDAARRDVDHSIELASGIGDASTLAHANFQAAAVAERTGDVKLARYYAETAESLFRELDDRLMVGRITNNLGGILFLLGDTPSALRHLEDAVSIALATGNIADAAQAISSIAQIHLKGGKHELAELEARNALEVLAEREDFLDETGNVQLVLARALLAQERFDEAGAALDDADRHFRQLGSASHSAAVSMTRGELMLARGECLEAVHAYRAAAEALQDFHF